MHSSCTHDQSDTAQHFRSCQILCTTPAQGDLHNKVSAAQEALLVRACEAHSSYQLHKARPCSSHYCFTATDGVSSHYCITANHIVSSHYCITATDVVSSHSCHHSCSYCDSGRQKRERRRKIGSHDERDRNKDEERDGGRDIEKETETETKKETEGQTEEKKGRCRYTHIFAHKCKYQHKHTHNGTRLHAGTHKDAHIFVTKLSLSHHVFESNHTSSVRGVWSNVYRKRLICTNTSISPAQREQTVKGSQGRTSQHFEGSRLERQVCI